MKKYIKKGKSYESIKIYEYLRNGDFKIELKKLIEYGTINYLIDDIETYYLNHIQELTYTTEISYHGIREIAWEEIKQLMVNRIDDYCVDSINERSIITVSIDYMSANFSAMSYNNLWTMGVTAFGDDYNSVISNYKTLINECSESWDESLESDFNRNYSLRFNLSEKAKYYLKNPSLIQK